LKRQLDPATGIASKTETTRGTPRMRRMLVGASILGITAIAALMLGVSLFVAADAGARVAPNSVVTHGSFEIGARRYSLTVTSCTAVDREPIDSASQNLIDNGYSKGEVLAAYGRVEDNGKRIASFEFDQSPEENRLPMPAGTKRVVTFWVTKWTNRHDYFTGERILAKPIATRAVSLRGTGSFVNPARLARVWVAFRKAVGEKRWKELDSGASFTPKETRLLRKLAGPTPRWSLAFRCVDHS
jgi:hypothetical protein